jgi:anaerobic magnesium-protoporphyrin IX monomethyl ester cyclase
MKLLLVHGPRPYWPFLHEQDNFLVPQSLVCLAAVARAAGVETRILDCMPRKVGYGSLGKAIAGWRPDVVGVGENHALYASEALRVCATAKAACPTVKTVVGGAHFANTLAVTLADENVDFVVLGEGERSFTNLLREMENTVPDYGSVRGIAFHPQLVGGEPTPELPYVVTEPEPLIENLDLLPPPAYDLLPMKLYGASRYLFSPGGTTIHHSRGCSGACSFCAFWIQMAERKIQDGKVLLRPRWRTKTAPVTADEAARLNRDFGKKSLVFVDDSFNLDPRWNDDFAGEMLRRRLRLNWFAFVRADCIVRDERLGILEKMVRAGLRHVCVGVERARDEELASFNKGFYSNETTRECFSILKRKYPQVFRQGTFIVGLREDTRDTVLEVGRLALELGLDFPAFHPLTPVPGTPLWDEARANGWLATEDFNDFDWSTPVMPTKYLSVDEIQDLVYELSKRAMTPAWYLRGILSRHEYSRRMYVWWTIVALKLAVAGLLQRLDPFHPGTYHRLVTPAWYER